MIVTESSLVKGRKILIIGDLIVDKTYHVDTLKISPEAPIPVASLRQAEPVITPGGAGLAAAYARKHNIPCTLLTAATRENTQWLKSTGLDVHNFDTSRNVTKTRYIDVASGYHLLRLDNDKVVEFPTITPDSLVAAVTNILNNYNIGVITVLDYRKGLLDSVQSCRALIELCARKCIPLYVDTRDGVKKYAGASILKLNTNEFVAAKAALNVEGTFDLIAKLELNQLIVTESSKGAQMYEKLTVTSAKPELSQYSGTPDVTGCGDVFDINFCYNWGIRARTLRESLQVAVENATKFAYSSVIERLKC